MATEAAVRAYQTVQRKSARDALILEHLGFVKHVLGRLLAELPEHVDRENLESAGVMGLVEAATQFDDSRGIAFTTYAYQRIRGSILDELRRNCPLPQSMLQRWNRIREAYATLGEEATPESLAAASGLTVAEVEDCLQAIRLTRPDAWYEELNDEVPCRVAESEAEERLHREDQLRLLTQFIERLPPRERMVFTLYHRDGLRLKEIGAALNLSEGRISRILSRAELGVREALQRRERGET